MLEPSAVEVLLRELSGDLLGLVRREPPWTPGCMTYFIGIGLRVRFTTSQSRMLDSQERQAFAREGSAVSNRSAPNVGPTIGLSAVGIAAAIVLILAVFGCSRPSTSGTARCRST